MSWELDFEREETIEDILRQAGLCGSFQKGEEAVLKLKKAEFIEAARVAGFSDARILLRHILPNVISSSIVFAASDMVMCMLTGASMSFLGLGVQPPTPEWGAILNEGRTYMSYASWMTFFPGLVLATTGVGLSLLGDSMTDILRRKGR